jgi:hypothetical protein
LSTVGAGATVLVGGFSAGKLRYRNAVNCQNPPQASILLAETNIFLLRGFEWKRV